MVNQINISQAEQFYTDTLKFYHPEFSLAVNDPLYDITVRVAKLYKIPEILALKEEVKNNRSLLQASTTTAAYDQLLGNYFIDRDTGSMKYITVKFYFNTNTGSFRIPAGSAITIEGVSFITNAEAVVNPSSYVLETTPPYQNKYSIVVPMRSTVSGQLLSVDVGVSVGTDFVPGAISGIILTTIGGSNPETNVEAFNRGKNLISIRNYVNDRSIKAQIAEKFPGAVDEVQTIGFQDPEMVRDYVLASVPKYQAQLNFSAPVALNITPETYRFFYSNSAGIVYAPSKAYTITPTSSHWQQHPLTKEYFVRIDVELISRANCIGFKQDYPITTQVALSPGAFQGILSSQPLYLGTRAYLGAWDELDGSPVLIHNSIAATDVYLKTKLIKRTLQMYVPPVKEGFIDFPSDLGPVMRINKVTDEQGVNILLYDFELPQGNDLYRFSGKDQASLFVNPGLVGTTISVEMMLAPVVLDIQKEFDKQTERLTNADLLAKAMYPIFVDGIIQIALTTGAVVDPLEETNLHQAIYDYLHNSTSTLIKSKIIDLVYQTMPEAKAVVSLDMAGEQMFPDGSKGQILTGDYVKPILSTALGISERNIQYVKNDWYFVYIN